MTYAVPDQENGTITYNGEEKEINKNTTYAICYDNSFKPIKIIFEERTFSQDNYNKNKEECAGMNHTSIRIKF